MSYIIKFGGMFHPAVFFQADEGAGGGSLPADLLSQVRGAFARAFSRAKVSGATERSHRFREPPLLILHALLNRIYRYAFDLRCIGFSAVKAGITA